MRNLVSTLKDVDISIKMSDYHELKERLHELFRELEKQLPLDHAWRGGKWREAEGLEKRIDKIFSGHGLWVDVLYMLKLMCLAHDVGRLEDARLTVLYGQTPIDKKLHGMRSVQIIAPVLEGPLGNFWHSLAEAIGHHGLIVMPGEGRFTSCYGYELCGLLRDLDKLGGFAKAALYTQDPATKVAQAKANELSWTVDNETAESGSIDTRIGVVDLLDEFRSGRLLTRSHCASYEAYMLQLLAWLGDFNSSELQAQAIKEGGPRLVLQYLKQQLGGENPQYVAIADYSLKNWGLVG